jgi:hypothetical protein
MARRTKQSRKTEDAFPAFTRFMGSFLKNRELEQQRVIARIQRAFRRSKPGPPKVGDVEELYHVVYQVYIQTALMVWAAKGYYVDGRLDDSYLGSRENVPQFFKALLLYVLQNEKERVPQVKAAIKCQGFRHENWFYLALTFAWDVFHIVATFEQSGYDRYVTKLFHRGPCEFSSMAEFLHEWDNAKTDHSSHLNETLGILMQIKVPYVGAMEENLAHEASKILGKRIVFEHPVKANKTGVYEPNIFHYNRNDYYLKGKPFKLLAVLWKRNGHRETETAIAYEIWGDEECSGRIPDAQYKLNRFFADNSIPLTVTKDGAFYSLIGDST